MVKIGAIHIVLIVIIVIAAYFLLLPKPTYNPSNDDSLNIIGSDSATVTVVEYSDFQCPACGVFYRTIEKQFITDYVNTGKAKLSYKHFPLSQIHENAQKAAEASECAADQGKFWEYHDKLFENQQALSIISLKKYASELGLNKEKFDACLDSGVMASRVSADFQEGINNNVGATPTFFINNRKVEGSLPYSSFSQIIESEMKR